MAISMQQAETRNSPSLGPVGVTIRRRISVELSKPQGELANVNLENTQGPEIAYGRDMLATFCRAHGVSAEKPIHLSPKMRLSFYAQTGQPNMVEFVNRQHPGEVTIRQKENALARAHRNRARWYAAKGHFSPFTTGHSLRQAYLHQTPRGPQLT